jgi:3-oxoadipate enol-lactonase
MAASDKLRAMAEARIDVLLAEPADPAVRSEVVETMARIPTAAYCIGAKAVWLADQTGRAREIGVPTLVLCGTKDKVTPPALSQELARLIPGAKLELIEGAGHIGNLEKPFEFNQILDRFIRNLD